MIRSQKSRKRSTTPDYRIYPLKAFVQRTEKSSAFKLQSISIGTLQATVGQHRTNRQTMKMTYIIIGIIIAGGLIFYLTSCTSKKQLSIQKSTDHTEEEKTKVQENPYSGFRNQSLSVTPDQLELKLDNNSTIAYGIIMDWDIGKAVATVVTFQTGDASLYISAGQIHIGGFAHENIKSAALTFINEGQNYLAKANLTTETPMPDKGCIRFYFLTNKGKYFIQETVENIQSEKSDLTKLFNLGNRVITEYRMLESK